MVSHLSSNAGKKIPRPWRPAEKAFFYKPIHPPTMADILDAHYSLIKGGFFPSITHLVKHFSNSVYACMPTENCVTDLKKREGEGGGHRAYKTEGSMVDEAEFESFREFTIDSGALKSWSCIEAIQHFL